MIRLDRRGFTLAELLISLVLLGIISTAIYQLLVRNQQVYRSQVARVDLNAAIRTAISIMPSDLRELNAGDTIDSDVVAIGPNAVTFKAARNLYVLCQLPVDLGGTVALIFWNDLRREFSTPVGWYGIRPLDPARDSIVVFAEGDSTTRMDNYWMHANVQSAGVAGTACPGGRPSLTVQVSNLEPNDADEDILVGAPARTLELVQVLSYNGADGNVWMGMRRFVKAGGWTDVEPLLGPLAPGGLTFTYYDAAGNVTNVPADVRRIRLAVIGETAVPVRTTTGAVGYIEDTLAAEIALRNNPR